MNSPHSERPCFRVLAIGDVFGKPGRKCISHFIERIREEIRPDFIVANGENAAGGFGITLKVFAMLTEELGVDAVTMGNHWMDKPEARELIDHPRFILPGNMENVNELFQGVRLIRSRSGTDVAVINLLGSAFMKGENRGPIETGEKLLTRVPQHVKIRIVDMHAETSSEKQAVGHHFARRVSLVYGTHTHVPTADERIFDGWTGFVTDVGMTGPYDSVVGIRKEAAIRRITSGVKKGFEPALGDPWLCALVGDMDPATGACFGVERIRWKAELTGAD